MTKNEMIKFYVEKMGMPVFPVVFSKDEKGKVNKRPAVQWGKYQKELPTEAELAEWCNHYTGWGMATGELSRIVVVDVDMDKLEEAESILGCTLHSPMMVQTASGGMHIYYRWGEELRNTVKIEGAPIDFRGDGGYVVIPPSEHEWGRYSWLQEPTDTLKMMLPELPEQIRALMSVNRSKIKVSLDSTAGVFHDGERNAASTVAIRALLGRIPQDLWATTGWHAFNDWCKTKCSPALDDAQIRATFVWWVRTNAQDNVNPEGKSTLQISLERIEERKLERLAPTTGYKELDEKIKGWIPGHLYVFTGETNSGKSAVCCNFAYRVYQQAKKVTYFALEPDVGVIEYIAGIHHKKKWNEITDEDLKIDLEGMTIFTKDDNMNLEKMVKTIQDMDRQDLIIVDHIGYFTSDGASKLSQTQQESNAVKKIITAAKRKHTAIIIIAHPRKPLGANKKNNPLTMNEISGSAAYKQDATDVMILHMDKDENDQYHLTNKNTGVILLPKVKTGMSGNVPIRFIPNSPIMLENSEAAIYGLQQIMPPEKPTQGSLKI